MITLCDLSVYEYIRDILLNCKSLNYSEIHQLLENCNFPEKLSSNIKSPNLNVLYITGIPLIHLPILS